MRRLIFLWIMMGAVGFSWATDYKLKKVADAKALKAGIEEVMESKNHMWARDKMDPAEAAMRKKRQAEFKERYKK